MSAGVRVRVFPDSEALARAAAEEIAAALAGATPSNPKRVLLSGGATPERLYRRLAGPALSGRIPWRAVECFLGDERAVPPDHPDSNIGMIRRSLLEPLGADAPPLYAMRGEAADLDAAALEYEALLRERFGAPAPAIPEFDLALLGLGADGHTASIFPGAVLPEDPSRLAVTLRPPGTDPARTHARITVTPALLLAARLMLFLATGASKAEALARTLAPKPGDAPTEAARIGPRSGNVLWLVDREAARLLPRGAGLRLEEAAA